MKAFLNFFIIGFIALTASACEAKTKNEKAKGTSKVETKIEHNIIRFTQTLREPTFKPSDPTVFKPIEITISIFDPDKNPVLIEFSVATPYQHLNFAELEKFEVIKNPKTNGKDFRITLKDKYYTDKSGSVKSYYRNFLLLPTVIEIKDGQIHVDEDRAQRQFKGTINHGSTTATSMSNHSFKPVKPLMELNVREPSTLISLAYEQYFKPKGIEFPLIAKKSTPSGTSEISYVSFYKPKPSINSASDVKLTGSLKNKENVIWKLVEQKTKPTLTEFLEVIGVTPKKSEKNPFSEYLSNRSLAGQLENDLPYAIAQFETAFPNAIWYALGRDIYLFGDAMDAYYKHQKQEDRVRRLAASQPSFDEENVDQVIEFLESNDFDFVNMTEKSQPRIIFDITSYSKGSRFSQSSQLMRAAYEKWKRLGRDPKKLLKLVNFVSVSSGPHVMIEPGVDIEDFFSNLTFEPAPSKILRVDGPMSLQYSAAWHGIYEKFKKNTNGKVFAPFHDPSTNRDKLAMLAELWDVAAIVMSDEFIEKVKKEKKRFSKPTATTTSEKKAPDCAEVLSKPIGL